MHRFSRSGSTAEDAERVDMEIITERLNEGKSVTFKVKYEGCFHVDEARGVTPVRAAFKQLKKQKEERRRRGQRQAPYKEFIVSLESVQVRDLISMEIEETYSLRSISYIVNDVRNRSYIGMIAQSPKTNSFVCLILKQDDGNARDVVQAMGHAFDLAYKKHLDAGKKGSSSGCEQMDSKTRSDQADEISILRMRLRDLAVLVPPEKLELYLRKQNIPEITHIPLLESPKKEGETSPTHEKPLPIVGPQLQNLLLDDDEDDTVPLSPDSDIEKRIRSISHNPSAGIPKVNPPPSNSGRNRRRRAFTSFDDPFAMGDFNAVEFTTFDELGMDYGSTVVPKSESTSSGKLL